MGDIKKDKKICFRVYEQGMVTYGQNKLGFSGYVDKCYLLLMVFIQGLHSDHAEPQVILTTSSYSLRGIACIA